MDVCSTPRLSDDPPLFCPNHASYGIFPITAFEGRFLRYSDSAQDFFESLASSSIDLDINSVKSLLLRFVEVSLVLFAHAHAHVEFLRSSENFQTE